jgi:catechol 2,3-dioxygenase-like lactoylglutathione lyase family enzyme
MTILNVDHINIVVSDLERSVAFYTEVLGFSETRRATLEGAWVEKIVGLEGVHAKVAYVVAPGGEPRLELLQYVSPKGETIAACSTPNTLGLRHIAFRVEDIEATCAKLRESGAKVFSDPVIVPAGVVSHDAGEKVLCYFLDPDGVLLELAEYR